MYETALMMTFLGPGIREVEQHLVDGAGRQLPLERIDRIAADDPQVAHGKLFAAQHQVPAPGAMYLDPEEVLCRTRDRLRDQRLAVAESDFDCATRVAGEECIQIE